MTGHYPVRLLGVILLVCWCLPKPAASGTAISFNPFVNVRNEYNDNLFNDDEDETDDSITKVSSGIDLITSNERWTSLLSAEAVLKTYSDNSDFNNVDKNFIGNLRTRLTERFTFSFNAGFASDSRNDRDFEDTGLIGEEQTLKTNKVIRKNTVLESSARYDLSETTTSSISYDIAINEFDDHEFSDDISQNISFKWNRDLYKPFSNAEIFIHTDYYWYESLEDPIDDPVYGEDYEKEIDLNSISLTAGAAADLSENITLTLQIGGRYNESESLSSVAGITVAKAEDTGWGPTGEITLARSGEINSLNFSLYHKLIPRTGSGGFVKNTAARFRYTHNFTENLRAGIRAGFYLNKSYGKLETDETDSQTIRAQPNLVYFLTETLAIECQYKYSQTHDSIDKTDIIRNIAMITISFRYPTIR